MAGVRILEYSVVSPGSPTFGMLLFSLVIVQSEGHNVDHIGLVYLVQYFIADKIFPSMASLY